jgi:hypothetical protein
VDERIDDDDVSAVVVTEELGKETVKSREGTL